MSELIAIEPQVPVAMGADAVCRLDVDPRPLAPVKHIKQQQELERGVRMRFLPHELSRALKMALRTVRVKHPWSYRVTGRGPAISDAKRSVRWRDRN